MSAQQDSDVWNERVGAPRSNVPLVALVPTYKVTPLALPLIEHLSHVCPTLIVDDCSPCTSDPVLVKASQTGARVLRMPDRSGIARSLNRGLAFAQEVGAPWLLTVDQDTTISERHIEDALGFLNSDMGRRLRIGALGPARIQVDRHEINLINDPRREFLDVPELIQSGSLWNVQAMTSLGGFSDSLGMDGIDAEACLRLRESGYLVVALYELVIIHEIGNTRVRRILGRDVHITRHSRTRLNAMVANRLRLFPRELRQSPTHAFRTIRRVITNYLLSSSGSRGISHTNVKNSLGNAQ